MAVVAAILIVCRVALEEDVSWAGWLVAGVMLVTVAGVRWPYGSLVLLITASVMPRFFVEVSGWKARPEHFAVAIISVVLGVRLLRHNEKIRLQLLDWWVLAYVVLNYVSSAFGSFAPSSTLRWALLNNLAVLPYFLIRWMVRSLGTLEKAFRILLVVGIAECAYGIFSYVSHHAFGTTTGMEVGQYLVDIAAPYGSQYEPNLFGAYAACCAVMWLALYLGEQKQRQILPICFLVASLATVLSFSRAALLALLAGIGWVIWRVRRLKNAPRVRLAPFAVGFALVLVIAATAAGAVLRERFGNLIEQGLTEETTVTRLIVNWEALLEVPNHPILGNGTASFNLTFDWAAYVPQWAGDNFWIGNAPLRILHDTGLLGLTAFLGFVVSICWKIGRGLRCQNNYSIVLLSLTAGAVVYAVLFQSSDGTNLAFCWVHLGFLASAAILVNDSKLSSQTVTLEGN